MKRRDFLSVTSSAVLMWPVGAIAQPGRVRSIAIMNTNAENDPEGQARIVSFRRGLQELGWMEGRNVRIHYRWRAGDPARGRALARELMALAPEVIVANGTPAVAALHQKTSIPAVGAFAQPGGAGLIVLPTALNNLHRTRLISLAAHYRLPAIYPFALYARSGGLASYGVDTIDLYRRLSAAKLLGITIAQSLQLRADEIIR
jgi:hypothetical protein